LIVALQFVVDDHTFDTRIALSESVGDLQVSPVNLGIVSRSRGFLRPE
jgi:hypothetical protein